MLSAFNGNHSSRLSPGGGEGGGQFHGIDHFARCRTGKISYGELLRIMNSHQVRGTTGENHSSACALSCALSNRSVEILSPTPEHVNNGTEAVDNEEGPSWLPLAEFRVGNFVTRAQPPTHANGGSELVCHCQRCLCSARGSFPACSSW